MILKLIPGCYLLSEIVYRNFITRVARINQENIFFEKITFCRKFPKLSTLRISSWTLILCVCHKTFHYSSHHWFLWFSRKLFFIIYSIISFFQISSNTLTMFINFVVTYSLQNYNFKRELYWCPEPQVCCPKGTGIWQGIGLMVTVCVRVCVWVCVCISSPLQTEVSGRWWRWLFMERKLCVISCGNCVTRLL